MLRKLLLLLVLGMIPALAQKVVENGEQPAGKARTIEFTEELRFGSDEDDNLIWSGASTSAVADHAGNIYVSDSGGKRVLAFDKDGGFIKLFGPNGSGPGEYQGSPLFVIFKKGGGLGLDNIPMSFPRIYGYDIDLNYKESIPTNGADANPISIFGMSPDGSLFGVFAFKIDFQTRKLQLLTGIMGSDLKFRQVLSTIDRSLPDPTRLSDPGFWEDYLAENFSQLAKGSAHICFDAQGNIYTAISTKYEIAKWSPDLKTQLMVIKKTYKPLPFEKADQEGIIENATVQIRSNPMLSQIVTEAVVRRATDKADLPAKKNPIYGLLMTDDGHLLVVRDLSLVDGNQLVDIFSPEGSYLGDVRLGGHPFLDFTINRPKMQFYGDKALTTSLNVEGEIQVVRYAWKLVDKK